MNANEREISRVSFVSICVYSRLKNSSEQPRMNANEREISSVSFVSICVYSWFKKLF